ncbi:hypothetical protein IAQ61_011068 [Plenodomus lingam]|uniref:uncharacterized protein n=1 Tax=Leptosphaeria maculans TaxID=5022 RepID=UPI00332B118B|nr:hypothetical protein IAQ61_011068 [Plenodomus lingam]
MHTMRLEASPHALFQDQGRITYGMLRRVFGGLKVLYGTMRKCGSRVKTWMDLFAEGFFFKKKILHYQLPPHCERHVYGISMIHVRSIVVMNDWKEAHHQDAG